MSSFFEEKVAGVFQALTHQRLECCKHDYRARAKPRKKKEANRSKTIWENQPVDRFDHVNCLFVLLKESAVFPL